MNIHPLVQNLDNQLKKDPYSCQVEWLANEIDAALPPNYAELHCESQLNDIRTIANDMPRDELRTHVLQKMVERYNTRYEQMNDKTPFQWTIMPSIMRQSECIIL